jgi:phage-related protein
MAVTAAQLQVVVGGDTKGAEGSLDTVNAKVDKSKGLFHDALGSALGFVAGALTIGGVVGVVSLLTSQVADCVQAGKNLQDVQAQTNAVIKSTKGVAGESAAAIADYAENLSKVTPFSAEAVQSSENLLLTFTNIGHNVFPQATGAITDMATAMHMDLQSATIMVGKALNDPIHGMTTLQRVGVTLSAAQKEQVKHFMAVGDAAGAQKVILGELTREFGGSAKAAGGTLAGALQIAKNQLEETKAKVGEALIPVLAKLMTIIGPIASGLAGPLSGALNLISGFITTVVIPAINQLLPVFKAILDGAKTLGGIILSALQPGLKILAGAFGGVKGPGLDTKGLINDIMGIVQKAVPFVKQLGQAFTEFAKWIVNDVVPAAKQFAEFVTSQVLPVVMNLVNFFLNNVMPILAKVVGIIISNLVPAFKAIVASIMQNVWPSLKQLISSLEELWNKISPILIPALQFLGGILQNVIVPVLKLVFGAVGLVITILANFTKGVADDIGAIGNLLGILGRLKDFLGGALTAAWNGLGKVVSGVWAGIQGAVKGGINVVISIINGMISAIDGLHINLPSVGPFGGGSIGFNIPLLPQLASGGLISKGGLALVGEKGPEVVYLPGGASVLPNTRGQTNAGAQQGGPMILTFQVDGRTLAQINAKYTPGVVRNATGVRSM